MRRALTTLRAVVSIPVLAIGIVGVAAFGLVIGLGMALSPFEAGAVRTPLRSVWRRRREPVLAAIATALVTHQDATRSTTPTVPSEAAAASPAPAASTSAAAAAPVTPHSSAFVEHVERTACGVFVLRDDDAGFIGASLNGRAMGRC